MPYLKNFFEVFCLYLIFGLMVYSNSLNNKFLIDDNLFLSNPVMSQTKYIAAQWNPFRQAALGVLDGQENLDYYRPMAHTLYDIIYAAFKKDYWKYHLLNLFVFAAAA